jgi:prepilin peptidase CpaA
MTVELIGYGIATTIAAVAAVTDWRTGRIPNWLTLPFLLIGPAMHAGARGIEGAALSILGIVACAAVPYLLFRKGAIGGGDVKLFAAAGGLVGAGVGIEAQFLAFIFAAFLALIKLAWDGRLLRTLQNALFVGINPIIPKTWRKHIEPEALTTIRLGVAIFCGMAVAVGQRFSVLWF